MLNIFNVFIFYLHMVWYLFHIFSPFSNWAIFFLILKIWEVFKYYYINKKSFVRYMVWNKPSHSIVCLFIFLTRMPQKKNNQFQWVQFINFFLCESYLCCLWSKNSWPSLRSQIFLQYFLLNVLVIFVLHLNLWSTVRIICIRSVFIFVLYFTQTYLYTYIHSYTHIYCT